VEEPLGSPSTAIERRQFIKAGLVAAASIILPGAALADEWLHATPRKPGPRELSFYNIHTDESLKTVYWENGSYVRDALVDIDYFFRDFRANEIRRIDPKLLDLLYNIRTHLDTTTPIELVSGYRSAATNAMLFAQTEGVSRHSMHVQGKAADIHVRGVELSDLRSAALALGAGGVGYYPRSEFVHVDTGRVRYW
jgi:uncharacterized protein YcbK (DUF882 family)